MMDDLGSVTSRIQEIQDRISSLSGQSASAGATQPEPGQAQAPTFAQTLQAVGQPGTTGTSLPHGPSGVTAPPASLGPLPPMPISPGMIAPYEGLIQTYAAKHHLEPALVHAVIQTESGGNPRAVSRAGAMGLMQLMPDNVQEAGIADAFDPEQNIAAGTQQLSDLLNKYHGNLDLALAGYNAGPGAVRKYGGVPPFTETRDYIRKIRTALEQQP